MNCIHWISRFTRDDISFLLLLCKILKSNKGLSLIEIMVTLGIVAMLLGLSVGVLFDSKEEKLSGAATQIASTIKMIFNEAAVKGQYFRLQIDLTENTLSPEFSSSPFKISSEEEEESQKKEEKPPIESDSENPDASSPQKPAAFAQVDSNILKVIKLPSGIKIKNIQVAHASSKIESGKASIYFFPNGWVEKTVINLSDEDEEVFYSLETFPASGKTKIRGSILELEKESEL